MNRSGRKLLSLLIVVLLMLGFIPISTYAEEGAETPVAVVNPTTELESQDMPLTLETEEVGDILMQQDGEETITTGSISGDYIYTDLVSGGARIDDYTGAGGHVDIPEVLNGRVVTEIGVDAFNGSTTLTDVTIPDTVTSLGLRSFYNCPNLESVFLGNGITSIGNGSFWGGHALRKLIIPASVTGIGYAAFNGCNALLSINIPASVTSIGDVVFGGCSLLTIHGVTGSTAQTYATANSIPFAAMTSSNVDCYYTTHVQNVGWLPDRENGAISGTSGQGLRLEGIRILIDNSEVNASIQYQTQIQNIGWQDWKTNGDTSGTTAQSLRLEGIRIRLTGVDAGNYDVFYRVHAQNYGWLDWARNGASAGAEGLSLRLEAIQIVIVPADSSAPGPTERPFVSADVACTYRTHIQAIGWQGWKTKGDISGTSGLGLRLEAIEIVANDNAMIFDVTYRTQIENIGWQDWKHSGETSGTSGLGLRLETIEIALYGEDAELYDVYYQVHAQNFGWMDWAKNGQSAGTEGYGYRLEGIRIVVVTKGQPVPGPTTTPFLIDL